MTQTHTTAAKFQYNPESNQGWCVHNLQSSISPSVFYKTQAKRETSKKAVLNENAHIHTQFLVIEGTEKSAPCMIFTLNLKLLGDKFLRF